MVLYLEHFVIVREFVSPSFLGIQRSKTDKDTIENTVNENITKARKSADSLISAGFHGNNGLDPSSERICFTILLWNFSSFSRFFLSGVITSRPYNKVRMTYPCMSSLCVYKYLGLVHYCRESLPDFHAFVMFSFTVFPMVSLSVLDLCIPRCAVFSTFGKLVPLI
jgi:hypothetical protein